MRPQYGQAAYRNACQFCHGRGCFDCDVKGKRAMEESFANPLIFKTDSPEDMDRLKSLFHADKLSTPEGLAAVHEAFAQNARDKHGE